MYIYVVVVRLIGDVVCDFYYKVYEDVKLLKNFGVSFYRFLILWFRIFLKGIVDELNFVGVDYYNKLIDLLVESNIILVIILYYFDLF